MSGMFGNLNLLRRVTEVTEPGDSGSERMSMGDVEEPSSSAPAQRRKSPAAWAERDPTAKSVGPARVVPVNGRDDQSNGSTPSDGTVKQETPKKRSKPLLGVTRASIRRWETQSQMYDFNPKADLLVADAKKHRMILPSSPMRMGWDIYVMVLIIYVAFVTPFVTAFEIVSEFGGDDAYSIVSSMIDMTFLCDLVINFRTAIVDPDGTYIVSAKAVAGRYLRGWFAVDFLSTIPFELITIAGGTSLSFLSSLKVVKLIRLLRLGRVVRLGRIFQHFQFQLELMGLVEVVRSFGVLLIVILVAHWSGCLFWLVFRLEENEDGYNGYFSRLNEDELVLNDASPSEQYAVALYWSIMTLTTIGYGDITPSTQSERIFISFVMLFSSTIFAYFVGKISALVSDQDVSNARFRQRMKELNSFMAARELPEQLRLRMRNFLNYRRSSNTFFDDDDILGDLSHSLRKEVVMHESEAIIRTVRYFGKAPVDMVERIALALHTEYCAPREVIYREGDKSDSLYIIARGSLVSVYSSVLGSTPTILREGQLFGETAALGASGEGVRATTVKTLSFCELRALFASEARQIFHMYPEVYIKIRVAALWGIVRKAFMMARIAVRFRSTASELIKGENGERKPRTSSGIAVTLTGILEKKSASFKPYARRMSHLLVERGAVLLPKTPSRTSSFRSNTGAYSHRSITPYDVASEHGDEHSPGSRLDYEGDGTMEVLAKHGRQLEMMQQTMDVLVDRIKGLEAALRSGGRMMSTNTAS